MLIELLNMQNDLRYLVRSQGYLIPTAIKVKWEYSLRLKATFFVNKMWNNSSPLHLKRRQMSVAANMTHPPLKHLVNVSSYKYDYVTKVCQRNTITKFLLRISPSGLYIFFILIWFKKWMYVLLWPFQPQKMKEICFYLEGLLALGQYFSFF